MNKDLEKFGFEKAGSWINLEDNKDSFGVTIPPEKHDSIFFLYAYVIGDNIMYIGKSDRTVRQRILSGWAKNKKKFDLKKSSTGGKYLYKEIVENNNTVDIYLCFPFDNILVSNIILPDAFESINHDKRIVAAKRGLLREMESYVINYMTAKKKCDWNGNS